jgi:hypothetical protein
MFMNELIHGGFMKIQLTNVKHAKFMSQETECFSATIVIDGKICGQVSNEGHGGGNIYHPWSVSTTLNDHAKTLPKMKTNYGELEMDADLVIGDLFTKWQLEKELKRTLKTRILFVRDGKLLQTNKGTSQDIEAEIKNPQLVTRLRAEKVLNQLSFDEALSIFTETVNI